MIQVLSFLSNENCFAGHSRGPCGPRFEHHWFEMMQRLFLAPLASLRVFDDKADQGN